MKFGLEFIVYDGALFEAADHLADSTAVLIAEIAGHVNPAFATKLDGRQDFDVVVGFDYQPASAAVITAPPRLAAGR